MTDSVKGRSKAAWRPAAATLRMRAIAWLILGDVAAITAGFFATWVARADFFYSRTPLFTAVLLPVFLVVGASTLAYDARCLRDPFAAIKRACYALAVSLALVLIASFYLRSTQDFSRVMTGIGSMLAFVFICGARWVIVPRLDTLAGGNPFSSALIHDGEVPIPGGSFSVVLDSSFGIDPDQHDPLMYDRLAQALASMDRVVIACMPDRRLAWARALRGANIQGELYLPELQALRPRGIGPDRDSPSLIVAVGPLSLVDRVVKRSFDIAVSLAALVILLPLMVVVAIWIKLDSPGPVLFTQTRIGRSNRIFRMAKFRSMCFGDDAGHRSTSRDDERITRVGRFIRSTSLDELPQLLNVLGGSMSIVGPRPHALGSRANDKLFWEVDDRYWDRHAAKPGLTGLAQVRGYRGATLVEQDLRNRVDADLEYLSNWSIWRDIKIIYLTTRVLLHQNAF